VPWVVRSPVGLLTLPEVRLPIEPVPVVLPVAPGLVVPGLVVPGLVVPGVVLVVRVGFVLVLLVVLPGVLLAVLLGVLPGVRKTERLLDPGVTSRASSLIADVLPTPARIPVLPPVAVLPPPEAVDPEVVDPGDPLMAPSICKMLPWEPAVPVDTAASLMAASPAADEFPKPSTTKI